MKLKIEFCWSSEYDPGWNDSLEIIVKDVSAAKESLLGYFKKEYPDVGGNCDSICMNVYEDGKFLFSGKYKWENINWYDSKINICPF